LLGKKHYNNGQKVYELTENTLTYFYKNGNPKTTVPFINELMESEWLFYRESGQLWQVGNFENNLKHGRFVRYEKKDEVEYDKTSLNGKLVDK